MKPTHHQHRARLRGFGYLRRLGPGLVTGASDDDPSGIGTYSQVGAAFGFGLLWTALVSLPLAAAVQETAARLGLSRGKGLGRPHQGAFPAAGAPRCGRAGDRSERVQYRRRSWCDGGLTSALGPGAA